MFYMTLMMVSPMVVLMVLAMRDMFPSKRLNTLLLLGSTVAFFGSFALIRTQTTIGDTALLRSMIPPHSGAILMCEQASLKHAQIRELCRGLIVGQAADIDPIGSASRRERASQYVEHTAVAVSLKTYISYNPSTSQYRQQ